MASLGRQEKLHPLIGQLLQPLDPHGVCEPKEQIGVRFLLRRINDPNVQILGHQ
jgi:hypothetical protein